MATSAATPTHPQVYSHEDRYAFGLTTVEVERLRDILRRGGVDLTLEQAWARAIDLIGLFRMLLGPLPEDRPEA